VVDWYAVYTKPHAEDVTATLLANAGLEVLNPKMLTKKYARKKYIDAVEQLFPCYIFAFFDTETHYHMIKYTRGVKYIVGKEHPLPVPSEIIDAIRERMKDGIVSPAEESFEKGERVLVREGPFKDFYGVFDRKIPGRQRAMILLEALHCKLDVECQSIRKA
jgi:transcriptional antiterminator RfaH